MRRESTTRGQKEFGDYLIGKTIGQGTFGKVKSAIHKSTQQQVAIKILEKSKISEVADVERVSRQIHILKLIRHPHIVQLYEIIETPKQLFLVMQFMEKGQLFDHIVKNKRIPETEAAKMFHQLISGIEYIHKIGVVHRDLKPENILLDSKQSLKIVDFGLSNTYKKGQLLKTPCGSPCYAAPEMIKGEKYDGLRVDIWSCGVILFAMLCGYLPFQDPDTPALYKKILSGSFTFHKSVSQNARDLISRILNGNQHDRYSINEIRNHPWLSQYQLKQSTPGIIIGFNKIPIEQDVLTQLRHLNIDPDYVSKCLEANRHNNATTAYYLSLKKYISEGGQTSYDLSSKSIDKSMMDINTNTHVHKRKLTANKYMLDNYLTKSTQTEIIARKRSKDKSINKIDKQNRCINVPHSVVTSIHTQSKKGKINKNKINQSFNYGRGTIGKSTEKGVKRQNQLENRISRKYKEKFNQSLVSRSRDKCTQRSRVNSSLAGVKRQLHQPTILLDQTTIHKPTKMKRYHGSIKCDTSKIIETTRMKPRRV